MTNKNPYEIRLDVLKLAKEMLEVEHNTAKDVWLTRYRDVNIDHMTSGGAAAFAASAPAAPTVDDVISKASALYNFVSDSSISNTRGMLTESSANTNTRYRK